MNKPDFKLFPFKYHCPPLDKRIDFAITKFRGIYGEPKHIRVAKINLEETQAIVKKLELDIEVYANGGTLKDEVELSL